MNQSLTLADIDESVRTKVYVQNYISGPTIDSVKLFPVKHFVTEDGDFSDIIRFNENGIFPEIPDFTVRQVNRSLVFPGTIKGWHLHLSQDELWYVPNDSQIILGLWDIRKTSTTKGVSMRVSSGGGKELLVYIPRGVAHGCVNGSGKDATIMYFVNAQFDAEKPDEHRIPFDALGTNFWTATRD